MSMLVGGFLSQTAPVDDVLFAGDAANVTQTDGVATYNSTVAIRFNTDGTVETGKSKDGAATTWTANGDWIVPNGSASSVFDVRFTTFNGASGGDWTTEAAADDIWIDLGTQRLWQMNSTVFEDISFTCDFEVRDGGGAPPATASSAYTFRVRNFG